MTRRELVALLGRVAAAAWPAVAAWPLSARAQKPARLPTIGFVGSGTPSADTPWTTAFVQRLRELGWIEGRTVAIEYRWGDESSERYAAIAAELVRLKVDVIVTGGTLPVAAAKRATTVIPIIFAAAGDPIGAGLVASLARPGGNVTGLSVQQSDSAAKRLELLRELVPGLHRLAILIHVDNPASALDLHEVQAAASALGFQVVPAEVGHAEDIAPAIAVAKGHADALYVATGPLLNTHRVRIAALASKASGQRGNSFEVRAPDTRPEPGSSARAERRERSCRNSPISIAPASTSALRTKIARVPWSWCAGSTTAAGRSRPMIGTRSRRAKSGLRRTGSRRATSCCA